MRYDQLREDAPSKNIESLIKTFVMSLVASGRTEVRTASIAKEIEKRYNINVPYGALMDILNSLPIVDDANEMNVSFGGENPDGVGSDTGESSEEKVRQMATKGASATKDI